MNKVQSIGVVVFDGEKVLLVRSGPASSHIDWKNGLPAGKVDPGETNAQAAVRELNEETGLITTEDSLMPIQTYNATIVQKKGPVHFIWHTFLCTKFSGSLVSSEETTPYWVDIDKLGEVKNLLPNIEHAVTLAHRLWISATP